MIVVLIVDLIVDSCVLCHAVVGWWVVKWMVGNHGVYHDLDFESALGGDGHDDCCDHGAGGGCGGCCKLEIM